jgi:hypothetical protein
LPQGRIGGLVSPQNGPAEIRAHLPKETELVFLVATSAKSVGCCSDSEYAEPVGIVEWPSSVTRFEPEMILNGATSTRRPASHSTSTSAESM